MQMQINYYESDQNDIEVGDIVEDENCKCILVCIVEVDINGDGEKYPFLVGQDKLEGLRNYRPYVTIDLDDGYEICRYRALEGVRENCKLIRKNKDIKITI